jgi:hypothetical protein
MAFSDFRYVETRYARESAVQVQRTPSIAASISRVNLYILGQLRRRARRIEAQEGPIFRGSSREHLRLFDQNCFKRVAAISVEDGQFVEKRGIGGNFLPLTAAVKVRDKHVAAVSGAGVWQCAVVRAVWAAPLQHLMSQQVEGDAVVVETVWIRVTTL